MVSPVEADATSALAEVTETSAPGVPALAGNAAMATTIVTPTIDTLKRFMLRLPILVILRRLIA